MRMVEELSKGWQVQGFDQKTKIGAVERKKEGWIRAEVPGVVHLDLLREEKLLDPFYALQEKNASWIEEKEWWYKNEFGFREFESQWKGRKKIELIFEGLDTFATIYLNGEKIGEADNMFIPWRFEVTGRIREKNVLLVKFSSSILVLREIQAKGESLRTTTDDRARLYGRKAQYAFGWDWGPRLPGVGVWRRAYVCSYDEMHLDWVGVESRLFEEKAEVKIDLEISSAVGEGQAGKVLIYLDQRRVKEESITVKPRYSKHILNLEIEKPILWYPKGYGAQHLYHLKVELFNKKEELMDTFQEKIGIREIQLIQKDDEGENSFYFKINGIPVFCKGANWIPADSFLPRVNKDRYRSLIRSGSRCGINMFRIWGGGIYEDREFYRFCDEEGIMIWQDFMFACGEYPEAGWFREKVRKEATWAVKSLRNHPCIVLWCGNNENHWLFGKEGKFKGWTIYHDILPLVCKETDPTRSYWPSSPYGGKDYNSEEEGDRHNWDVWSRWKDIELYEEDQGKFMSEFGFQAPPVMESIREFCPPDQLKQDSSSMEWHNKQVEGSALLIHYLQGYMPETKSFEEFVRYTQLNQAYALRVMIEHCRRRKFTSGGVLFWQFNDCWPAISWSVIDYYLRPKASYYAVKRAFEPVIISLQKKRGQIETWICNDTLKKIEGKLQLKSMSFEGETFWTEKKQVSVDANQSVKVLAKLISEMGVESTKKGFVYVSLSTDEGRVENHLFLEREKNLEFPCRRFEKRIYDSKDRLEIELYASTFVRSVVLAVPGENPEFSDNFFDLVPGVSKRVTVTSPRGKQAIIGDRVLIV